jgi:hypothetical protein
MHRNRRDIVPHRSETRGALIGFACSACGWLYPVDIERLLDTAAPKIEVVVHSFENHSCEANPTGEGARQDQP